MSTVEDVDDVEQVAWNLEPLVDGRGETGAVALLDEADALATELERHRGHVAELDAAGLVTYMRALEQLEDATTRAGSYAQLRFAADTSDPARGALVAKVTERATQIETRLVFFDIEWAALDDEHVERLLADPALSFCAYHLRAVRRYRNHLLTEPEERISTEKSVTGRTAWARLFTEQASSIRVQLDGKVTSLEVALAQLQDPSPERRRVAAEAVTEGLTPGLRTRAYIFNTLLLDKAVDDRLRRYPTWLTSMNLANQASDDSVQALVSAVKGRYDIPRRWYRIKAKLLGVDRLHDYDRLAAVSSREGEFAWADARALVLDAYASFSPVLAEQAQQFFSDRWIDAPARAGKRGGAFCSYTTPSLHPYVLLNWTGKRRDVLTLAHELGHGLHACLARRQGVFHFWTGLTLAETASVFGETVTFGRLLARATDPEERLSLCAASIEDAIATVFRQTAMNQFEAAVHTARRTEGELAVERINELWETTQAEMLGDAVEITPGYRSWWSYIPHFISTPGYVYAYAYGQLLALSVYRQYELRGEGFVPQYLELLGAGGSRKPEELARIVDCDLTDPAFWDGGLTIVDAQLARAEDAARAAGRLTA